MSSFQQALWCTRWPSVIFTQPRRRSPNMHADVVVLEPAELRDFVVRGLTAVAESVSAA